MKYLILLFCLVPSLAFAKHADEWYPITERMPATVTDVRSISSAGSDRHLAPIYAVDISTADTVYHLYCENFSPDSGRTYKIEEGYATDGLSALKLWPLTRGLIVLPTGVSNKGSRLYRIVVIDDALEMNSTRPNFPCDIHSKTPRALGPVAEAK